MAKEIERKWLVNPADAYIQKQGKPYDEITQCYLNEVPEVRIRRMTYSAGSCITDTEYYLTVKVGNGLVRTEVEKEISRQDWEAIYPTRISDLVKVRYDVRLGSTNKHQLAHLDIYDGDNRGLCTVEVEFLSEVDANCFRPPNWFGDEVTGDSKYSNRNLATKVVEVLPW